MQNISWRQSAEPIVICASIGLVRVGMCIIVWDRNAPTHSIICIFSSTTEIQFKFFSIQSTKPYTLYNTYQLLYKNVNNQYQ